MGNPAVVAQEGADDWGVLVNMDTADTLALNPTAMLVWSLIDGQRSVDEIAREVMEQFEDAPESVVQDVEDLLGTLSEDGFVGYEWKGDEDE